MVRCGHRVVRRTCGSVRSSLSAPARLVTVESEAAETASLHRCDEEISARRFPRLRASVWSEGRLDEMPNASELPTGIVNSKEPKTLRGSGQNRQRSRCSILSMEHTDIQTAGVEAGANPFVSLESNIVNPTSRLLVLRQARPQGTLTGWRAEETGESKRRSVTERTGMATSSRRANGLTSSWSFVTRERAEPS